MLYLLLFIAVLNGTQSARILGIFPQPSISHQVVFKAYIEELLKHGHEVVFVTPNPIQSNNKYITNLTEIDIGDIYNEIGPVLNSSFANAKRGVIRDADSLLHVGIYEAIISAIAEIFKSPEVIRLIEDKSRYFDLVVIEAFMNYHLVSSKLFNAPVVLLSSFYGVTENFEVMGGVSRHPNLYPNMLRNKFRQLSTWETIIECYNEYKIMKRLKDIEDIENVLLKKNFGPDVPSIYELKNNVAMLLLSSHPVFADNRPVPPGVIFLGALHLKPVKELPKDLKHYLDNSKTGVVYVSFGSNVQPELMENDLLEAFIDAFEVLPYDVLWKYNGVLKRVPKNLRIEKWFPQRDLLTHPNIKVFVTQGGMQSTDEGIDAGVPLVGIPMHGDQWLNTNRYIQLGIGVQLDTFTLTANDLITAVQIVVEDKSYRENVKHLKAIINDQPQRPLERAVWWTEHVLRHGAAHLRAPAANMSWAEYLMLDIFIPVLLVLIVFITVTFVIILYIIKSLLMTTSTKQTKVKIK